MSAANSTSGARVASAAHRGPQRMARRGPESLDSSGDRLDMGGRGATTATDERCSEIDEATGVAGEVRWIGSVAETAGDEVTVGIRAENVQGMGT